MATTREAFLPVSDNMATSSVLRLHEKTIVFQRKNTQSIEERCFLAALITLEGHFEMLPAFGTRTSPQAKKIIQNTLDMSLNRVAVREALAKNVDIWMRLEKIMILAIPRLISRSLRDSYKEAGTSAGMDVPESASLILKNFELLVHDLGFITNLMVISRNMLAVKETAQDLCAVVRFDKAVRQLIILCVNLTSKGYDGEHLDDLGRGRLNEVTEQYKKLLITCLQHTHNWTMGNDKTKMSFCFDMLFDLDLRNDAMHDVPPDNLDVEKLHTEVKHWLQRNSTREQVARERLERYSADVLLGHTPGPLPEPLYQPEPGHVAKAEAQPEWRENIQDKYEQDCIYGRVSHELDMWWRRVRDPNYEKWTMPMESVADAKARADELKSSYMLRYGPGAEQPDYGGSHEVGPGDELHNQDDFDIRSMEPEVGEDDGDEDDEDEEDDSYVEGPLRGLLTEIPNILEPKQIEALHMTVKACVVDSMGSGLTVAGENLQKTRCKLFLALDCGKNALREILVFIAVWEQNDSQFIFQITAQIIEAFHHNALLPYVWASLKIVKDIVSPAQTVLLRLINYMFRARKQSPIYDDTRDFNRDAKLLHFLYNYFRCRLIPDCTALIHVQAQIRQNKIHPSDFPVDSWDMERAKEGLSQYLDLLTIVTDIAEMRPLLIEWEAVYELTTLLHALEEGVARKSLDEDINSGQFSADGQRSFDSAPDTQVVQGSIQAHQDGHIHPNLPPLHDSPHKYPWAGVKVQVLVILTSLLAPSNKNRSGPGNPSVQQQLLKYNGVRAVLSCMNYDGHNEYLTERATLATKWIMDGCEEAQDIVSNLCPLKVTTNGPLRTSVPVPKALSESSNAPRRARVASDAAESADQKTRADHVKTTPIALPHASGELGHSVAQDIARKLKQLQERPDTENVLAEVIQLTKRFEEHLNDFAV